MSLKTSNPGSGIAGKPAGLPPGKFAIAAFTVAWLLLGLLAAPLGAQDARGTMLGRVTDGTGAVVPGVDVRATNTATGVVAAAETNPSGNYVIPYLLPGTYKVTAEISGFKRFLRDGVQVRIADSVELDIQMQVGDVAESVEVRAETPLLSTAEASLGQVIDERRVLELPLFAGNPLDLVHLAPGIVNTANLRLRKAGWNNAPSQFSTDGGGQYKNEFTIDGVSNTYSDGTQPRVAFSPPATAVQEFRVQTSSFDASLGHTGGGTVNLSTKSGTNDLHGEAHWWLRHAKLDSRTLFQARAGQTLPVYQDNRYGASAGAPVIIPKVYNGRNRTFWFYAWEANKWGVPTDFTATVPTEAVRRGDLSGLLALGGNYQVYDPKTTAPAPNGRFSRQPFAGNIIPTSRLDPAGQKLMGLYPLPNQAGAADGRNNYFRAGKALEDYWVHMGRVDHAFSDKHRVFVRFHRDWWEEDKNRTFNDDVNGIVLNRSNRGLALDDVYVISPTFLLNLRYGLTHQDFPERRVSRGISLASLGFSQNLVNLVDPKLATVPRLQADALTALGGWESGDGSTSSLIHSVVANITKLKGNHNLRFGTEFRAYREFMARFPYDTSPNLDFASTYTRGPFDNSTAQPVGGEMAALLLGVPDGSMSRTATAAEQNLHYSLYLQDDFKVTPKLTVNLGFRWEYETPITERYDRSVVGFAYDTASPIDAQARAKYAAGTQIPELPLSQFRLMGGLTFANTGGNGRTFWTGEKNNLMPRVGLAYQLGRATVLRAGYGLYVIPIGILFTNSIQTGFTQSTPIQASLDSGLTYRATTADPFPNGLIAPAGAAGGLNTYLGQNISFFRSERKNPYTQKWTFGLQHQLPYQWLVDVSYVGSRTTRMNLNRNINHTPGQYYSTLPYRDQATHDYMSRTFASPLQGTNPIYGANISRANLLKPYPHFGDVTVYSEPMGYAWYNAMQARVERRFSQGYTFQLSYTWSKAMEAVDFLNVSDPLPYRVLSGDDRTHRLVMSGIWELPFGHRRRFGSGWHPAVNFIAGGWQLTGVVQRQSGPPINWGSNIFFNGDIKSIPLSKDERSVARWFNTDAGFVKNSAQQPSTYNLRTFPLRFSGIRSDGQARWDFGIIKNFPIRERATMQFRAETFNAWNHPNLNAPSVGVTSAAFGSITGQDQPRSWQFALKLDF